MSDDAQTEPTPETLCATVIASGPTQLNLELDSSLVQWCALGTRVRVVFDNPPDPAAKPKRCPECGGEAAVRYFRQFEKCVYCEGTCGLRGPGRPTRTEALAAWNRLRMEGE